jgi:hypothetical protein
MATEHQVFFLHVCGGRLVLWDDLRQAWSWSNVMTRYHEAYHDRLLACAAGDQGPEAANIHETLRVKDPKALGALQFDDHTRVSFIDRFGPSQKTATDAVPLTQEYEVTTEESSVRCEAPGVITKTFTPTDQGLRVEIDLHTQEPWYVCELNLAVWWEEREREFDASTFTIGTAEHRLVLRASSPVHVELSPIRTVSNSEGGIETIYQGMALLLALDLETSRHLTLEIGG